VLCLRVLSRRNLSHLSRRCSPNSRLINRLEPLFYPEPRRDLLFSTPGLCFQQLAASFPKVPGVGYPECNYGTPGWGVPKHVSLPTHQPASSSLRQLSALCVSLPRLPRASRGASRGALSFAVALIRSSRRFLCPPLTTFRINTCKSVSKQRALTIFRMNTYEKGGEGGGASLRHSLRWLMCQEAGYRSRPAERFANCRSAGV
jgi:hypothetical protein